MHRVPDRHTDAHHTLTHTKDSFTVKDKWRLTLWPGEMAWLNSSEMKILLTKVPWAKQVVSLGNRNADFCSSRAKRQSKRAPNNHTESWQSLSPRHKLADWQLNGRMYSGPCVSSLQTQTTHELCIIMTSGLSYYRYIWHFINRELSQPIPAFVCRQRAASVRDVIEDFKSDVCLLYWETKAAAAQGLWYCGSPRNGQEGRILRDPSPLGTITSVSHCAPSRALGSRAVPVRPKNNRGLSLYMQGNYVEIHTVEALLYRLYHWKKQGTMTEEKEQRKEKSL